MTPELLRKPILLGGLGLTAGAWLLHGLDPSVVHLGSSAVWSAIAVGSGLWWLKSQLPKSSEPELISLQMIDRAMVEKAFRTTETEIEHLVQELAEAGEVTVQPFRQQLAALKQQLDRKEVELTVLGSRSVGKTTVMKALKLVADAPESDAPEAGEATLRQEVEPLNATVTNADLVLFVVAGDLTDSEFQTIQQLVKNHHRLLLVFNKQDQYLPADRPVILQQLRNRLQGLVAAEDLVAVSAQPAPVKVRQHQADGTLQERIEQPLPDVQALQTRLQELLTTQAQSLILATSFRQAQALQQTVQQQLNQVRRNRALPIIEQYQWIAAAAAFANPVASLDLLVTATINAQMVMDLGALYQQSCSLEQAKTVTGNLASQMVKLGLVEMASQAISPLLKSHALTYVAGGTLQGISAAYLTRLAGLSLVEYFEEQSQTAEATSFQLDRLIQKLKDVFQDNQRSAFLQNLVKQGVSRLVPQATAQAG
jgi:GTPase SAR1 family protein